MKNLSAKHIEPKHLIPISFTRYGKNFTVDVKIYENDAELNKYYKLIRRSPNQHKSGVYACALFEIPTRKNKNNIGELLFSLEHLHPSLVAHETVHMVFQYFGETHGLDFKTRRREETFCSILETIMDTIYRYIETHKISYNTVPPYRK